MSIDATPRDDVVDHSREASVRLRCDQGWEAISLTPLPDGTTAVLFKRPKRP
jgi:hypothetical protein